MIHLFPKLKNRMLLISACCIAFSGVYIIISGGNLAVSLMIAVIGVTLTILSHLIISVNMHNQLIARLYNQLDLEGFLRDYEPLAKLSLKNQNLILMVRLHLSNAYCAQGRFSDAESLLSSLSFSKGKKPENELLSRFAQVSNLCYCAQQQNDLVRAQAYLDELLALKKHLEEIQTSKPEKKRMVFNTELNELVMSFLSTGKTDIEALRTLVKNDSQLLHKITISLWIARAYLAENNRREAETLLNKIVKHAPDLYPGKAAASILASLPGSPEENV